MYNVARLCKKKAPAGPAGLLFLTNFRSAIYKPCRLDVEMKLGAVRGRACATSDLSVVTTAYHATIASSKSFARSSGPAGRGDSLVTRC